MLPKYWQEYKKIMHSDLEFKDRFLVFSWLSNDEFLGLLKKVDEL